MLAERRQIVELWKHGQAAALATLVGVTGSSYRRPGARLIIASDGTYAGAISGGCLEAEVLRKARWLVREGACLQRYSTLFDDTADIPYGLGCGGTVDVLLEPAGTPEFELLMTALDGSLQGRTHHVMTQLPGHASKLRRRVRVGPEHGPFEPHEQTGADEPGWFSETLMPPQRLLVFGAGDDAQPLVRMAVLLGWTVVVVDSRQQWARTERFPEAQLVLHTYDTAALEIVETDAAVVMTHSYEQDRACLTSLLPRSPRYLGLLGARHRSALLLSEAAATLGWELQDACEKVFAPIGLDIGGDGAEAIALAIVAEIQACLESRLPAVRRMTPESVAVQLANGSAARYLQTRCAV